MEGYKKNSFYKYCAVPMCGNNIVNAPDKIYFHMPKDENVRKTWCKAIRRDFVSCLSSLYCCEDHFDIENDTENYIRYKIMALGHGQKMSLRLKKGVLPHKFQCQKKDKLRPPQEKKGTLKRKNRALVEEVLPEAALPEAKQSEAGLNKMPNDMQNYMEYHVMGSVSKVSMKPGIVPTKFECQARKTAKDEERPHMIKKLRKQLIEECEEEIKRKRKELKERSAAEKVKEAKASSNSADHSAACHGECAPPPAPSGPPPAEEGESSLQEEGESSLQEEGESNLQEEGESSLQELCLLSPPLDIKEEIEIEENPLTGVSPPPDVKVEIQLEENPPTGPSPPDIEAETEIDEYTLSASGTSPLDIEESEFVEDPLSERNPPPDIKVKIQLEENPPSGPSPPDLEERELEEDAAILIDYEALLSKLQQEVADLKTENQRLVRENKLLTEITSNFINENVETDSGTQYIVATTKAFKIINKLKDENQKLAEEKVNLTKEVERLNKAIETYTDIIQRLTEKNVSFLEKIKDLEWNAQGMNSMTSKSTENNKLAENNRELCDRILCLNIKLEDLNKEINELKNKKLEEKQLDGQNSRKPQNFKELAQIRSLTEENQNLTEKIEALNEQLEECRKKAVRVSKRKRKLV